MSRHLPFTWVAAVVLAASTNLLWRAPLHAQALDSGHQSFDNFQTFGAANVFDPNNAEAFTFDRGENVSVRQRPRPDYDAEGIRTGGFLIYPKITLGTAYDDNVYDVQTGRVSDEIFTVNPEIDIQSTWSRDALNAYVRMSQDWYRSYTNEDATQYGAGLAGKLEFGNSSFNTGVNYGHYVLPQWTDTGGATPEHRILYDYTDLDAELVHTFNRLRLSGRGDYQIYEYQDGQTSDGLPILEQDQNRDVGTFVGKAEYAVGPSTAVFISGAFNFRNYNYQPPLVPFDRNSQGYYIAGGANFDLTHLVRGEIQFGYLDQEYTSSLFKPIKGVSAKGQIEWFPTELTTVTLTGSRAVGDSGVVNSAGYLTTNGAIQVDHELLRNLILSANATVGHDQYVGIVRNDDRWGAGFSGTWLFSRRIGLTLAYGYIDQKSSGVDQGPSFGDNRITLSTVLQF